jgi:predicted alpha/beta hydrolase
MTTMTTATDFQPAQVLGCTEDEAALLLAGKRVTPGEVEAIAMTVYDWRRHLRDPRSYWLTATQAAAVLHVSTPVVRRMLDEDRLPHVTHVSGVRLMRRHDIEDLALARMR